MSQYYRYHVELINGGGQIRIDARDPTGEIMNEPGGTCHLDQIPDRIKALVGKVRRGTARPDEMDELGEALFQALFPPEVTGHLRDLLTRVDREDAILRLELDLNENDLPAVAALPWEFLRAPQTARRAVDDLATHPRVVLSRRRALWNPADPIVLSEPLQIQLVVSAPEALGAVAYEEVESALHALAGQHPDLIAPPLPTLHQPDITTLEETLEAHEPHILHFIGHGRLRQTDGHEVGELALIGVAGQPDWRTDEEIGEVFQVHRPAIILLQACESGAEGSAGAFVGVASQIVQRNVPVVVAMQYPVSNVVAITFSEEFYRRLGQLQPVDMAVQRGRRRLKQQFRDTRDFAAPVLLMRVKDGRLFVSPEQPASAREEDQSGSLQLFFDDEQRQAAEKRLVIHNRNLNTLQERAALYGAGAVPLHLHNQIEEEKRAIEALKKRLGK